MLMRYILSAALCAATLLPAALQAQTITTVAGNGGTGDTGDGGAATSANVGSPWGMAAAADGSYYIGGYNLIRRVGADGVIRAAAGDGTWGSEGDGGPATSARLAGNMNGLAIGPDGHLYIADTFNSRIRKIDGGGTISTVVEIEWPNALGFDPAGNMYIGGACVVHRRTPDGTLSRFAGTGTCGATAGDGGQASQAVLASWVYGIAVDTAGNVWLSHDGEAAADRRLRKIRPDGVISTPAIVGAAVEGPIGLAADSAGRVYAVQRNAHTVIRIDADGTTATLVAGRTYFPGFEGDGGPATDAKLNVPAGMAIANGHFLVADTHNHRVRKVTADVSPIPFAPRPTTTCAGEGYTGTKLEWCRNICERGYTGSTLATWIRRWTDRYRTLPYCAVEPEG
ncbi:MAG: hypothetical protein KBA36_11845 [Thermomonas sp.]|nr:hypothetical protein [Thermomonas sp.]